MKLHEIRRMAKGMGIDPRGMNKEDIIRSIQRAENNIDCYGTERAGNCQELKCLWRSNCLALNTARKG